MPSAMMCLMLCFKKVNSGMSEPEAFSSGSGWPDHAARMVGDRGLTVACHFRPKGQGLTGKYASSPGSGVLACGEYE